MNILLSFKDTKELKNFKKRPLFFFIKYRGNFNY